MHSLSIYTTVGTWTKAIHKINTATCTLHEIFSREYDIKRCVKEKVILLTDTIMVSDGT